MFCYLDAPKPVTISKGTSSVEWNQYHYKNAGLNAKSEL